MKKLEEIISKLDEHIQDSIYDSRQDWCENKEKLMIEIQLLIVAKANIEQVIKISNNQ
jgi:hypothetical protein